MAFTTATVLAVASLTIGVIQAQAQLEEGKQEQKAQEFNAQIAGQQADLVRKKADLGEFKARKRLKAFSSEQRALFAKSGVTLSGSPLDVIQDSAANAEFDIAIDRFNLETQARGFESEAEQRRVLGKQARRRSKLRAGITLLTSVASAGQKFAPASTPATATAAAGTKTKVGQ